MNPRSSPFDVVTVVCPYCGEEVELALEGDLAGEMVIDCEVCCRPWQVSTCRDEQGSRRIEIGRME